MKPAAGDSTAPCRTILLVEDDLDIRETLSDVLRLEGYEVVTAANGREAIDVLDHSTTPPSLILADLMMPVMDGWQLLAELRASGERRKIPVIVSTAANDKLPSGVPILRKPLELDTLLRMVAASCR